MTHSPAPADSAADRVIRVSAIVMRDDTGRVLNVRKRGTDAFMLPGGKPEPGESAAETALREFAEELGIELDPDRLSTVGVFRAAAANEPGFVVEAAVFGHPLVPAALAAGAHAEIDAVEWIDPAAERSDIAPLTTEFVFPALRSA
ncbi:NUDIX domain-containing protein [Leucobacter sp. CSA2]|uniref:NUDIX domain-containing protein n=1 Tax=Leucobacter edaphi TaxID=2796472 RepID=A0A934QBE8_9MICO|nr:NUDIX domain-containing protein [Leucobacter edaphi]MBK0420646.1 NUDIX domain-containing protein [Leucobacter edaphi]